MPRENRKARHRDGRGWCYFGMALGGSISVLVLAAAAPIILWVMLEILIRVKGRNLAAWVVRLMAVVVAAVAFITSYQHLHDLLLARGESTLTARIYPFGVDGLLVGAGVVLWFLRTGTAAVLAPRTVPSPVEDGTEVDPEPVLVPSSPSPAVEVRPEDRPLAVPAVVLASSSVPSSSRTTVPVVEDRPQDGEDDRPHGEDRPEDRPRPRPQVEDELDPAVLAVLRRAEDAIARGDLRPRPSRDDLKSVLKVGTGPATAVRRILAGRPDTIPA